MHIELLSGRSVNALEEREDKAEELNNQPYCVVAGSANYVSTGRTPLASAQPSSIAVIPVQGPIMKNDSCGDAGTMTMAQWVREAAANPNVSAIVMKVDSPGGTVAGTQTLSDAIAEAKLQKPVVTFVEEGMMASAAYWVGSGANEIVASQSTDQIGSIGVYTTMFDLKEYYAKDGIKIEDVYSSISTQKNEDHRHFAATGTPSPKLIEGLDFIANKFIGVVKANRGSKINIENGDPFKGRLFNAEEAVANGLIDSIGNFNHALTRAMELATSAPYASTQTENMKINFKSSWLALAALFTGGNADAKAPETLGEEHWDQANAALSARDQQIVELTAQIEQLNAARTDAESAIQALTSERDQLQSTIATYGTKPGATHTNALKPVDAIADEEISAVVAALPHNKTADHVSPPKN